MESLIEVITEFPPGWKVVKPISVTLEIDDDGTIIISDDIFFKYGAGDTQTEALNAYIENLTVYYEVLEESISDEYPENEKYLGFIKGYIQRTRGNHG